MSQPNPLYDEDKVCCEWWCEVEDGVGNSHEWCNALVKKDMGSPMRYGQCSCSGTIAECNNGMFIPQIRDDDPTEDR